MTIPSAGTRACYAGIDCGAWATKVVVIDATRRIVGRAVQRSGVSFEAAAEAALEEALASAGAARGEIARTVATGYGRANVAFAHEAVTEITCHARGAYFHFPEAITIVDIGGQDCKLIELDSGGRRVSFKMNRKCAAGTGAFLEEIALRLNLPLEDLNGLASRSTEDIVLGSFCTVFAQTEILARIREGIAVEDIVKGVFGSVVKRIVEMGTLRGAVVMTGGVVAHNAFLVQMLEKELGTGVAVPPQPQLIGALGAALSALP